MTTTSLSTILDDAFSNRYGVPAINVVNDLTMEAVLRGAVQAGSPVIVQTSVKTVRSVGVDVLAAMWRAMTEGIDVPVCLHLDHCPDREVLSECLRAGWNSVLFDASLLPIEENLRQTIEVVAEARRYGANVEGEIEHIQGVEDGVGSDEASAQHSLDVTLDFLRRTEVDVFAPAIGNAHGAYTRTPTLDGDRVSAIVAAHPIPIALHGGSGLTDEQFRDLISRGCAKVNISTALKTTFMRSSLRELRRAEETDRWDPPSVFRSVGDDVAALTVQLAEILGSAERAPGAG
ncbi:MAG TPA: class II fructose-bisphosphate aldolase [Nocardioides sp.]|jgi:fructose-bisphosphate aldolase class II|uniref:class II fructose-bisphosphate aldolase n=1 Tax=Nocardioides sp. TaxID=35761 RepID=UPI002E365C8E|nr:class II fructose-bisphosphate aldolase [Nocardioides sp.]HEX3929390.1 class II fructose-bisphosphate aldolase [Nocardioides sp.]